MTKIAAGAIILSLCSFSVSAGVLLALRIFGVV